MNEMQLFQFDKWRIRVIDRDGAPWWVLADVCEALGIANVGNAADRIEEDEKNTIRLPDGIAGNPNKTIINESGLYTVILRSDKPEAKRFRHWITAEVLPSIRKTGAYLTKSNPTGRELIALALVEAQKIISERDEALAIAAPKVEFFDQVADSKDAIPMRDAAAALNIQGMGRNNLFSFLRDNSILDDKNIPYREYQDRGYFRVVERSWTDNFGESHVTLTTLVYQRGLDYLRKLITNGQK